MTKKSAIVFDLDGTLIDSAPDIQRIANDLLSAEGRRPISIEETKSFIGNGSTVFVRRLRTASNIPDSEHDRLFRTFMDSYLSAVELTQPYPGVVSALETLVSDHALGICTNKPAEPTRRILDHLNMSRFFSAVIGGDSLPSIKPDPSPLHAAFEALGTAGRHLYVGDSEVDAEAARRAGIPFVLYPHGYRKKPIEDFPTATLLNHFDELPRLVSGMTSSR